MVDPSMIAQNTRSQVGKEVHALYPEYFQEQYLHVNLKEVGEQPLELRCRLLRNETMKSPDNGKTMGRKKGKFGFQGFYSIYTSDDIVIQ